MFVNLSSNIFTNDFQNSPNMRHVKDISCETEVGKDVANIRVIKGAIH